MPFRAVIMGGNAHSLCTQLVHITRSSHRVLGKTHIQADASGLTLNSQPRVLAGDKQAELELIAPKGPSLKNSCVLITAQQDGKTTKRKTNEKAGPICGKSQQGS